MSRERITCIHERRSHSPIGRRADDACLHFGLGLVPGKESLDVALWNSKQSPTWLMEDAFRQLAPLNLAQYRRGKPGCQFFKSCSSCVRLSLYMSQRAYGIPKALKRVENAVFL